MPTKLLSVQRPGVCRSCGFQLRVGAEAWWDSDAQQFQCASCAGSVFQVERRSSSRIARVAKFFNDTDASSDVAERVHRERMLSVHLHSQLGHRAVVLDDRKGPGAKVQIDHIVIAPSGVWVIEANECDGKIERRDVGGWFKVDERLYVAGKDRTGLVDGIDRQVMAVEQVLAKDGLDQIPVHAALCFVNSDWGWFAKPFSLNGVWVTWASKLTELIMDWNAIPTTEIDRLARVVGSKLPSAA
ncbi:MAG TPA: nuclease-related domain-containing protein [Ilumatobacteraceae bacterium]|nr:nuclease-related domain-containing protein [Ilumatobacteraceae bacterium]